jgi:hypothetical protein
VQTQGNDIVQTKVNGVVQLLGMKGHIAVGAALGTLIPLPIIGNIIGGYLGYRRWKGKSKGAPQGRVDIIDREAKKPELVNQNDEDLVEMKVAIEKVEKQKSREPSVGMGARTAKKGSGELYDPERLKEMEVWLNNVSRQILSKDYEGAYDQLIGDELSKKWFGVHVTIASRLDRRSAEAHARGNRYEQGSNQIFLFSPPSEWFKKPEEAERVLPMHLEEYMHAYQSKSNRFLSTDTEAFKRTGKVPDPADAGEVKGANYDEIDVLAKLHDWGFKVDDIGYVDRYNERKAYWEWYQKEGKSTSQLKSAGPETVQRVAFQAPGVAREAENKTGMPDGLKTSMESMSGFDLSDVKVHYNSSQPAQLNALAYAQGSDIHIGPGQEQHLPHEAWHVVQQRQGRVLPTMQLRESVPVNDDPGLEKEADMMGQKAIQRKVGFEFEEERWRAWIDRPLIGPRPAKRKEVLHAGTGFELQADDSLGANQPTIEFVTKPFAPSIVGIGELTTAMGEIKHIMQSIAPFRGRDETQGNYVMSNEHQLSNASVRLSQGHSIGLFKMQATQGISLEDVPTLLKYTGANVPGETLAEQGDRAGSRSLMRGNLAPGATGNVIGSAPALADTAIQRLITNGAGLTAADRLVFTANAERLAGFLSLVMIYVKMLSAPNQLWVKYMLPILARTDFATMFALLPLDQKTALGDHNSQAFIDAVIFAANSVALIPALGAGHYDTGYMPASPLLRAYQPMNETAPVMQSLSISEWLRGISGIPPVDHLNVDNIKPWLETNEPNLWFWNRNKKSEYLESVSSMQGHTEPRERVGASRLIILENRGIAPGGGVYNNTYGGAGPGKMDPDEMTKAAKDYLLYFINMLSRNGDPGPFPDTH